jgi:translation elongation factor EF-1beta|tara:strand:- start:607 stop:900 length:294 start_codon:yes stop_codon:yes gene_type:complete
MIKQKTKDVIKILEDNKLTNIYSPEDQIKMQLNKKVETLESQKEELALGMKESRHQEYVRKEMDKIRAEGWQENSVSDTHKIIKEAERRVKERGDNS